MRVKGCMRFQLVRCHILSNQTTKDGGENHNGRKYLCDRPDLFASLTDTAYGIAVLSA